MENHQQLRCTAGEAWSLQAGFSWSMQVAHQYISIETENPMVDYGPNGSPHIFLHMNDVDPRDLQGIFLFKKKIDSTTNHHVWHISFGEFSLLFLIVEPHVYQSQGFEGKLFPLVAHFCWAHVQP